MENLKSQIECFVQNMTKQLMDRGMSEAEAHDFVSKGAEEYMKMEFKEAK